MNTVQIPARQCTASATDVFSVLCCALRPLYPAPLELPVASDSGRCQGTGRRFCAEACPCRQDRNEIPPPPPAVRPDCQRLRSCRCQNRIMKNIIINTVTYRRRNQITFRISVLRDRPLEWQGFGAVGVPKGGTEFLGSSNGPMSMRPVKKHSRIEIPRLTDP